MEVSKLHELGGILKAHRESRGLACEDIALRIKISPKKLYAIEDGQIDCLPQPVFTKSFIRSYAQAMDMDMDDIASRIEEAFPSNVINNIKADLTTSAREQSISVNSRLFGKKAVLALLLAAVLVLATALFYFDKMSGDHGIGAAGAASGQHEAFRTNIVTPSATGAGGAAESRTESTAAAEDSTASGTELPTASGAPEAEAATEPATPATGNTASRSAAGGAESASSGSGSAPSSVAVRPAAAGTATENTVSQSNASASAPLPSGGHRLVVSAVSGDCWVGAKFDERGERNVRLSNGKHFVLDFKDKATLTLGNAASVTVSYNGKPVRFTAADGDVRILSFPQ